jgi:hypothetical protein
MENLTNVSLSCQADTLELKFLLTLPNILIIIILSLGLWQMCLGIEITHPVYMALFCNLITHLCASIVEILMALFLTDIRMTTLVKASTTLCILFHCCCWFVLSTLRYIYIIHSDWLSKKIPTNQTITIFTMLAIYTLFLVCSVPIFLPTIYFGWPYKEVYEFEKTQMLICILSVLLTYFVLLGSSCFFYFLLLHRRGAMGQNAVATYKDQNEIQDQHEKDQNQCKTSGNEDCQIYFCNANPASSPHCCNVNLELNNGTNCTHHVNHFHVRQALYFFNLVFSFLNQRFFNFLEKHTLEA